MATEIVLGLGSNRGDSADILRRAVEDLSSIIIDIRVSSLYRTDPQDYHDQDDFCNVVCAGRYDGTPRELLARIHEIESRYGRNRSVEIPKGPRSLDIDILLFGDSSMHDEDLVIPHERLSFRQFALVPLLEIMPKCADPVTGERYREISARLADQGVRKAGSLYGN
jgi:2-amino-4-hydroxy-6-hydroxymethyldihydropteridine diphosphokinase